MDWTEHLVENETIVWQGKPAPRCYTFRNWAHSLFGLVLLVSCAVWLYVGINLEQEYQSAVYTWIPVPFLLASLYLIIGHLLVARLEWESVFYAVSDERLLVQNGLFRKRVASVPLKEIVWFRMTPISETLGTVSVRSAANKEPLVVKCIEHPRQLTDLLEKTLASNGIVTND